MINFEYYTPTKVVFGKDTETQTGELIKAGGYNKILLHYGGKSARDSGLLDRIKNSLNNNKLEFIELGGVVANPRLSLVREGVELCKNNGIDFILAVGGGSVIDSAKAIGLGAVADNDVWDFYIGKYVPQSCLPIGTVLTLAAAGSEMSNSVVITNEDIGSKRGLASDFVRPKFAIMNPMLTMTLPAYQTAVGCVDILMHTMERYFTPEEPTMDITDGIAEALLRSTMKNAKILVRDPSDYEARAEIMWAGSLSHNGLTGCGGGRGDWACHQMGHELSAKYDLAHGASLSAVWGSWARFVYEKYPDRFAQFAENVMELPFDGSAEDMALAGIEEMEGFFWSIEMPTSLSEAGINIDDGEAHELATRCTYYGERTVGALVKLGEKELTEIFKMAK